MKFLSYGKDGGAESTVWGLWLVEIKSLFSVAVLCFEDGSREAYHDHAFNSISWLIKGKLIEHFLPHEGFCRTNIHSPSPLPIWTPRDRFHKVQSKGRSWVLTFRGPWYPFWHEFLPKDKRYQTLTSGRKVVA